MPVVEIQWEDSCSTSGWKSIERAKDWASHIPCMTTVGILFEKTDAAVTVVSGVDADISVSGLFQIPRSCILKMRTIAKVRIYG